MIIKTELHKGQKLYLVIIGEKCFGYLNVEKALVAIAKALKGGMPDASLADTYEINGWQL